MYAIINFKTNFAFHIHFKKDTKETLGCKLFFSQSFIEHVISFVVLKLCRLLIGLYKLPISKSSQIYRMINFVYHHYRGIHNFFVIYLIPWYTILFHDNMQFWGFDCLICICGSDRISLNSFTNKVNLTLVSIFCFFNRGILSFFVLNIDTKFKKKSLLTLHY